jgi:hypothetical protein
MGTPNVVADRVLVTFGSTASTDPYVFTSAVAGYLAPGAAGVPNGARVAYVAVNSQTAPTLFEVGEGVFTAATSQITRATVHRTHTGGTTAVTWGAGPNYLFLAPSAARLPILETDGRLTLTGGLNVTGGGVTATGNSTITGTLSTGALTVSSGGATVTGNSTVTGTLAVTSTLTAANGTSGTQVVNFGQFPATKATTGTTTLPNGLIMKWGTGAVFSGVGSVTYDVAFPNATLNVQLTIATGIGATTQDALIVGAAVTAAGFPAYGNAASTLSFFWFAVGY